MKPPAQFRVFSGGRGDGHSPPGVRAGLAAFAAIACCAALFVGRPASAQLADPSSQLDRLSIEERIDIKLRCDGKSRRVADYRKCIWAELNQIKKGPPDPQAELGRLSIEESLSIKSKCRRESKRVVDYRECAWEELASLGIAQPRRAARRAAPNDQGARSSLPWRDSESNRAKSSPDVSAAQKILNELGYETGPVDGLKGPRTIAAIKKFQRDEGVQWDGDLIEGFLVAIVTDPAMRPMIDKLMGYDPNGRAASRPPARSRARVGAEGWSPLARLPAPRANSRAMTPRDLFRLVNPSVWVVYAAESVAELKSETGKISQGSAVAVSTSRLVTNCHVVRNRPAIIVLRGEEAFAALLISSDRQSDRCVLEVRDGTLKPVPGVRPFDQLEVGERVFTVGAPRGLENTLGEGIISGLRKLEGIALVQTTAPISPGSSGGGLFDELGNLVGVTTLYLRESDGLNFAIAASEYWRK